MKKTTTIAALSAVVAALAMGQGDIHVITEPDLLAYGYATTNEVAAGVSALKEDVDSRGYAPTNAVRAIVEGYGYVTESVTNGLASTEYVDAHEWDWSSVTNHGTFAKVEGDGYINDGYRIWDLNRYVTEAITNGLASQEWVKGLTDYDIGIYGESGGIFKTMDNVTTWVKNLSGWSLRDTAPTPSASDMRSYILGAHETLETILNGDAPVPRAGHAASANHATYLWSDSKEYGFTYASLTTALDGKADALPAVRDLSWSIPVNSVSSSTTTNFDLGLVYGGILASDDGVHIGTMGRVRDNTLLYRTADSKVYSVHDGAWWLVGQYPGFVHTTENGVSSDPPNCAIAIGNDAGAAPCAVSIGQEASAYENRAVVVGEQAAGMEDGVALGWRARSYSKQGVAIGRQAHAGEPNGTLPNSSIPTPAAYSQAVAIGYNARARAQGAVQIGDGINTEANTMRFRGDRVAMMTDVTNIVQDVCNQLFTKLATDGLNIGGTTYYLTTVAPTNLTPSSLRLYDAYGMADISASSVSMTTREGSALDMSADGMASPDDAHAGFYYYDSRSGQSSYYTFPAGGYGKIAIESTRGALGGGYIDGTNVVAIGMVLSQPSGSDEESEEQSDQQDSDEESEGASEGASEEVPEEQSDQQASDEESEATSEEQPDQQDSGTSDDTSGEEPEEEPVYESAAKPLTLDREQESNK